MNPFYRTVIFIALVSTSSLSQLQEATSSYAVPPSPTIGWDSLKSLIQYPELLRRAGFEGAATIYVQVDSTGKVDTTIVNANSPLFEQSVRQALSQTTWRPGIFGHRAGRGSVSQSVHFYIKGQSRISIEVDRAISQPMNRDHGAR
jgi:outer membrane biosynthesis protein TonB